MEDSRPLTMTNPIYMRPVIAGGVQFLAPIQRVLNRPLFRGGQSSVNLLSVQIFINNVSDESGELGVVLRVSHYFLESFYRMKPRSGYWAVTVTKTSVPEGMQCHEQELQMSLSSRPHGEVVRYMCSPPVQPSPALNSDALRGQTQMYQTPPLLLKGQGWPQLPTLDCLFNYDPKEPDQILCRLDTRNFWKVHMIPQTNKNNRQLFSAYGQKMCSHQHGLGFSHLIHLLPAGRGFKSLQGCYEGVTVQVELLKQSVEAHEQHLSRSESFLTVIRTSQAFKALLKSSVSIGQSGLQLIRHSDNLLLFAGHSLWRKEGLELGYHLVAAKGTIAHVIEKTLCPGAIAYRAMAGKVRGRVHAGDCTILTHPQSSLSKPPSLSLRHPWIYNVWSNGQPVCKVGVEAMPLPPLAKPSADDSLGETPRMT
uniref:Uncharacterized protein n=1 Tax=Timema poppense TaxID=170557 RepID=A0A7R9DB57_TIMPO|nr:unnamed protein product [Timema poppensis]